MQKYQGIKGDDVIQTLSFTTPGTASSTQTFAAGTMTASPTKLKITNPSTSIVHVGIGNSTVSAATTSPVVGPSSVQYFRFGAGDSVAIRTASGTASTNVYAEAVL